MSRTFRTLPDSGAAFEKTVTTHTDSRGQPLLMNAHEVAALLRTSRKAVYALVERRQIPGVTRLGRRVLFRSDVLLHWLRQKSTPSLER
jgi:excisionase family DNA binding protein